MTTLAPEPMNATEVTQVRALVSAHGLAESVATDIFKRKLGVVDARAHILDTLATRGDETRVGFTGASAMGGASATLDDPTFHAKVVGDVIYSRLSGKPPEGPARELMDTSLVDLAREMIERRGVRNAFRMRPTEVLDASAFSGQRNTASNSRVSPWIGSTAQGAVTHTTADFPGLLLDGGQRYLLDMYAAAGSVLKIVARERSARDFRAMKGYRLSGFGQLNTINEGGEFKYGTLTERKESYAVSTFGKMFSLTRQAIVNDDLGAFGDMFRIMGRAAAETEASALATLLMSNPIMGDAQPLFSASHGNYLATGTRPDISGLDVMRQSMRTQKDDDGETILNIPAKYLVVPAGLETEAQVITGQTIWAPSPSGSGAGAGTAPNLWGPNPFAGALVPLTEPRLTGPAWYAFADPAVAPVLEYAYLDGVPGPQTEQQQGWAVLGLEFRVYMHFGCGMTGHTGAYKNAGA